MLGDDDFTVIPKDKEKCACHDYSRYVENQQDILFALDTMDMVLVDLKATLCKLSSMVDNMEAKLSNLDNKVSKIIEKNMDAREINLVLRRYPNDKTAVAPFVPSTSTS